MNKIKDIIISITEPINKNVIWAKPTNKGIYLLYMYGTNGWVKINQFSEGESSGNINFEFVEEVPNIIINK